MLMEVMISKENFDYLVEKWYTDSQRRSFFSGVKRVFRETCRSEPKDALSQEIKMKFIFYNMLLNFWAYLQKNN